MATAPTYSRVSPGLYRSSTGQLTPQSQIKKPTVGTPVSTATPTQTGQQPADVAAQRRKYQEAVNRRGRFTAGSQEYNNNASIIKDLGSRLGFNWQKQIGADWTANPTTASTTEAPAPVTSEPAPTTAAPASVPVIGSQYANYNSPMTGALLKAMGQGMNTMQAYEPKNFEGSPLYQFQKQKGMQDMEKLMASRGLTGSGAEVQANSDFLVNLNAQESEKQRQYADQAAQRQQQAMQFIANFDQGEKNALREQWNTDLDRQTNIGQFEATRGDRRQEIATNFLQNLLNMQSNSNIATLSQGGLDKQTALTDQLMKAISSVKANNYARSYGGGGGTPPVAPNSGEMDLMRILMGYGNRAGNNDTTDGLLRLFTGG